MGAPTGPWVKEHKGGGVIEPDTQPLAGKLALSVKRALYATSIIHGIQKHHKHKTMSHLIRIRLPFAGFKGSCV